MVNKKGFTLIELIIVIAVIAILATTVILVLNPAVILAEARDSQRIADLGQMNTALSLYLAQSTAVDLDVAGVCGTDWWSSASAAANGNKPFATPAAVTAARTHTATPRAIDGTGWIAVDLSSGGASPALSAFPFDPTNTVTGVNTTALIYSYQCSGTSYELNANMESTKYQTDEGNDGGNQASIYEVGNDVGLNL